MDSKAKGSPKPPSNTREATTVTHSKFRTIFGKTKNSVYIIKEQKYEIKKFPFPLDTDFFQADKPDEDNCQKNTASPTKDIFVERVYEDLPPNEKKGPAEKTLLENLTDLKEEKMGSSIPIVESQADIKNQCKLELEEDPNTLSDIQRISLELDAVFKHRVNDIESKAPADLVLKIRTYQEWIETLLKRNNIAIESLKALKEELGDSIELSAIDADTRLRSYRDRDVLVKFIQEAFHSGEWNMDYLKLETVTLAEFLQKDLDRSSTESGSSREYSSPNGKRRSKPKQSPYNMRT